jgi:hypothetical protein
MLEWITGLADQLGLTLTGVLWTASLAAVLFLGSIGMVTLLAVYLPATYFLDRERRGFWIDRHPVVRWTAIVFKNLIGGVLVVVGLVFLLTPGQGLLTILIGVMLLDFPGKRWLEKKLISRPSVLRAVNRLRARFGKEPLQIEEPASPRLVTRSGRPLVTTETVDKRN